MKNWVVTGGVGSGKSSLCRILCRISEGVMCCFSCDEAAHQLWNDPEFEARIATEFGFQLAEHGTPRATRRAVGDLVFRDIALKKRLEAIMHPPILRMLADKRSAAQKAGIAKVFLAEVPLYYETQPSIPADTVIVVAASRTVQCARLMEHRKLDADVSEGMLNAQLPLELKINKADVVVWNDGSSAILEAQALLLLRDRWGECELPNHV